MTGNIVRDPCFAPAGDTTALRDVRVGARVWMDGERMGWTVRARDDRYVILTQPFNLKHTVLYTVADLDHGIRGCDDFMGLGYETDEQIARAMQMFSDRVAEISRRNNVTLRVDRVR